MEDFVVVDLPMKLAALLGFQRVLICAVEMAGAAMLRGVASAWTRTKTEEGHRFDVDGSAWLRVPDEARAELEHLFCKARRTKSTDDVLTYGDADSEHTAKRHGKDVRHSRQHHVSLYRNRGRARV